ncbi:MAG: putative toxin-antitoxin system toxin component, PIN family [Bacteroides sp.]|nr:putative toxin-antitoxin system toxin component, PIN family [Bacteroides sp.]
MIYAVIDTNVMVSALLSRNPDASTVRVLEAVAEGVICPLFNQEIIAEYKEVLSRPKFHLPLEAVEQTVKYIQKVGIEAERVPCSEDFPDLDDVVFYEVALSQEDAFLVTGNTKHFPKSPIVVTPAEMMRIILTQSTY